MKRDMSSHTVNDQGNVDTFLMNFDSKNDHIGSRVRDCIEAEEVQV